MGLLDGYYNFVQNVHAARERGRNMLYGSPEERMAKAQGLLGEAPGAYQLSPDEQFANEQIPGLQTAGSGLLGSDMGLGDRMKFRLGMLGTGYSPGEIGSVMQPVINRQKYMQGLGDPTTLQQQFEYYKSLPVPQQQELLEYRRSGAVNLGQGGVGVPYTSAQKEQAGFNPQSVVIPDKNGIPRVISKEQFTQPQILSGGFATRMSTATSEINSLKGSGVDPAGIIQNLDMFGTPDVLVNFMRSPEGQRYRQAQENWITANLRKESGAAIPEEETEREIKKWFPQPGDSPEVIAQKERARGDAQRSMVKASGGAFQDLEDQADMDELMQLRQEQGQ